MGESQLRNVGRDAGLPQVGGRVEGGPPRVHHVQRQVEDGALGRRNQQVLARDTLLRHRVPAHTQQTSESDKNDPLNVTQQQASRLDIRKQFYSQRVVDAWNKVPTDIKNSVTVSSFEMAYKKHRGELEATT